MGLKKYRIQNKLFVAEGEKLIRDLLESGLELHSLFTCEEVSLPNIPSRTIDSKTLQKISSLKTSNGWLAVFHLPKDVPLDEKGLIVALDAVRDPGNLGTIIRLCDWFGVDQLICSEDTVDCFNPKVIQATMGSIGRVGVYYIDLYTFLKGTQIPIYSAVLEGESIYEAKLPKEGILLMGSEAHGVSDNLIELSDKGITIPKFSKGVGAESLNVATATAILLNEFRRSTGR